MVYVHGVIIVGRRFVRYCIYHGFKHVYELRDVSQPASERNGGRGEKNTVFLTCSQLLITFNRLEYTIKNIDYDSLKDSESVRMRTLHWHWSYTISKGSIAS